MARLEYQMREVSAEGYETATLVELAGSIDPDTLEIFEEAMDQLTEAGKIRVIFDMHRLKYINSTGMGMMVQFVDSLREEGGGLVLLRMQPKVLLVVEMLGLQELFQIVSTEAEALVALAGGEVGPASVEVKLEEADEVKSANVPEAVPVIEAEEPAEAAPISGTIHCPACQAELVVPTEGTYRCSRCSSALQVNAEAEVEAYPETAEQITEMSIPTGDGYVSGAKQIVALAGREAGLNNDVADAAAASAEGCLRLLASAALNGDAPDKRLHLFVRPAKGHLTVRIYCGGKALASAETFSSYREGVDRLDYMPSPQGNLLTLEKKV